MNIHLGRGSLSLLYPHFSVPLLQPTPTPQGPYAASLGPQSTSHLSWIAPASCTSLPSTWITRPIPYLLNSYLSSVFPPSHDFPQEAFLYTPATCWSLGSLLYAARAPWLFVSTFLPHWIVISCSLVSLHHWPEDSLRQGLCHLAHCWITRLWGQSQHLVGTE